MKLKLVEMCGENVGIKHFSQVIDGFEVRLTFSNTGVPIKTIYDVGSEFEHYFVIYSHKNYFLYYIENEMVYVMEMYDEREDFARTLFGIVTTSKETLEYWNRRTHVKKNFECDKRYPGILSLFWMECPYFAFKITD